MKAKEINEILANSFGEDYTSVIANDNYEIKQLSTDSRNHTKPGETLFFAIKSQGGNDGHKFISHLYDMGVRNFVVQALNEDIKNLKDANFFIVTDSIKALAEIGKSQRHNAREIVAITGSRGKTTVKEIIHQLIEPYRKVSRSPRSYNSKIGVPLSLWQIKPDSDIALIEAGISKKGEMKFLTETIDPDTVIITNVGEAHADGFSSLDEKVKEKASLAMSENVKTIIYPKDNLLLHSIFSKFQGIKELISWSATDKQATLFVNGRDDKLEYLWGGKKNELNIKLLKEYDIENLAISLAFLLKEGIRVEDIKERLQKLQRINTRLNVSEGINGCTVILDSYTSDISSLIPAIDFMKRRQMPSQTPTLVLSDLHQEGKSGDEIYNEVANLIRDTGIENFIGVGENMVRYSHLFPEGSRFYLNTAELLNNIAASDFNDEIILLKGSNEYGFNKIYELIEVKKHETVLEVNLDALLRNYNYFRSKVPNTTGIIAMVKASGYGAGSYEIAKTLQDAGASYLAVAALDEGLDLRKSGIVMPILVMNPRAANYRALFKNRLEPVIYSMNMLHILIKEAETYHVGDYPVHIKLDTGMHRMGFESHELNEVSNLLKTVKNIRVASIFSHLATADCLDMDQYTLRQLDRFEKMSDVIIGQLNYPVKRHILNSAGILRFPEYHYDLVRLGIGLYGANTLPEDIERPLSPVSTLRSVVISVREVSGDEAVGYSRNGKISGSRRIATVPVGYADGINRKFGNGAINVMINGHKVPTIGNICMDAFMIDVTGVECKEGDTVEIFGENMSLQTLADTLDTIPYEILTSVSPRVKRVYYRE